MNNRKKRSVSEKIIEVNNKRRRDDLTCVICHGPASGYNFAQISCNSCKGKCTCKLFLYKFLFSIRIFSSYGFDTHSMMIFNRKITITNF